MRVKGLSQSTRDFAYLDSTSACLPTGSALLFMDADGRTGYVRFMQIDYYEVKYMVCRFGKPENVISGGVLSQWGKWPWSRLTSHMTDIYLDGAKCPHFAWMPFAFLHFDRSKILKVCMMPLDKADAALKGEISVDWLTTDYIGDRVQTDEKTTGQAGER
jgi:hypothetical protein